ncbi:MAG: DUF2092 domain-containing protein [Planctomycetes bacterium]|nr:DUF2092 domain-containing protein [Planctomycetota bacterium]
MNSTKSRLVALTIGVLILGTNACSESIAPDTIKTSPEEILKKVVDTYETLETYKSEGTIISDIDTGGTKVKTETEFSILLKKPNLYLISWTQKNMPMPGMAQSGTVWSDGTQPYLYTGILNTYSKVTNDEMALASATGISGGAAFTIPTLFLSVFKEQPAPLSRLKNLKVEKTEVIEGEDCYVLTGSSEISAKETLWISKTSYLIRKYYRSLESPEGGIVIPELSDEEIEEALEGMGQDVTEEGKRNLKEMMEKSRTMLVTEKLEGSSTELHANVSSPELDKSDLEFAVPEGAVLKDSLF